MKIITILPNLDRILLEWEDVLGLEYSGYKNHIYRMINFCFALKKCNHEEQKKIIVAGAFHDIGIWTDNTANYIAPSIHYATEYLKRENLNEWTSEISLMIGEHHKLSKYNKTTPHLVETFRKADLIDFSLGIFKYGIKKSYINAVKSKFPNCCFHKNLAKRGTKWIIKHPLNPLPMIKI